MHLNKIIHLCVYHVLPPLHSAFLTFDIFLIFHLLVSYIRQTKTLCLKCILIKSEFPNCMQSTWVDVSGGVAVAYPAKSLLFPIRSSKGYTYKHTGGQHTYAYFVMFSFLCFYLFLYFIFVRPSLWTFWSNIYHQNRWTEFSWVQFSSLSLVCIIFVALIYFYFYFCFFFS